MRRLVPSVVPLVPVLLLAACTDIQPTEPTGRRDVVPPPSAQGRLGDPLPGLTAEQLAAFARGKVVFERQFTQAEGLGPTFNANSCVECHGEDDGVTGGTGDEVERHFTRLNADGSCGKLANHGGFIKQEKATQLLRDSTDFTDEPFPSVTHQRGHRITPDLFGFGLIAAIRESDILALEDPNDADGDGISGRAHFVGGVVGRFGRKASATDLDGFNTGAFLFEMGITTHAFPEENSVGRWVIGGDSIPASVDPVAVRELGDNDLDDLNAFVRFLAPPPDTMVLFADENPAGLFRSIGCAKCHTPEFTTAPSAIAALSEKEVRPFSDFLLHDMGPELADICLVNAAPSEFRTEPLMGARFMTRFMHHGQASTISQAISMHGGEAANSRDRFFNELTTAQRNAVIGYINTL